MRQDILNSYADYDDVIAGADRLILPTVLSDDERGSLIDDHLSMVLHKERSQALTEAVKRASHYLSEHSESAIRDLAQASETDQMLRVSFWEEVSECIKGNKVIVESNVYNGICHQSYWVKLKTPEMEAKLAYILTPVKEYTRMNKVLLAQGQQILLDILNANPYVGKGSDKRLDARIAKVQLEAYKLVEERIYGRAVQRVQTHNVNEDKRSESIDVESLKAEIKQLETAHMDLLTVEDLQLKQEIIE